jgi:hypothetical protein
MLVEAAMGQWIAQHIPCEVYIQFCYTTEHRQAVEINFQRGYRDLLTGLAKHDVAGSSLNQSKDVNNTAGTTEQA